MFGSILISWSVVNPVSSFPILSWTPCIKMTMCNVFDSYFRKTDTLFIFFMAITYVRQSFRLLFNLKRQKLSQHCHQQFFHNFNSPRHIFIRDIFLTFVREIGGIYSIKISIFRRCQQKILYANKIYYYCKCIVNLALRLNEKH